jgi:hypothetical protein
MRVAHHKPGHRLRHTVVAAAIGAAAGGISVANCEGIGCQRGKENLAWASVTAGIGALLERYCLGGTAGKLSIDDMSCDPTHGFRLHTCVGKLQNLRFAHAAG